MRPSEVLRRATTYLERHGVESPRETAEVLLASVLRTDRAGLYSRSEGLDHVEARTFGRALCRRCAGAPVQHLTGRQGFRGLDLAVRPGVFVPRPETEVLVEAALAMVWQPEPVVVDVGTGTGAVALSIAAERPDATVYATDVSAEAVILARENASRLGLEVEVLEGDLLTPVPPGVAGRVDLVVSNPPYVREDDREPLPREVLADPPLALFGGTRVHERLAREAPRWLRPRGALVMEIGETQAEEVTSLLAERYRDLRVLPDLAGRDRIVTGRLR